MVYARVNKTRYVLVTVSTNKRQLTSPETHCLCFPFNFSFNKQDEMCSVCYARDSTCPGSIQLKTFWHCRPPPCPLLAELAMWYWRKCKNVIFLYDFNEIYSYYAQSTHTLTVREAPKTPTWPGLSCSPPTASLSQASPSTTSLLTPSFLPKGAAPHSFKNLSSSTMWQEITVFVYPAFIFFLKKRQYHKWL